ncbi:hypothetical protein [Mycoplasmopsis alligatoris]|uniref:Uncharacterized protein n=1 Tax=Mycoplasmopsis alligatoris A21JP2 TaxID=747682 RepID=D4XV78_9BACT|nr:hypothetical protein [Mycoplasmopsis alligatoris]EFF41750.1 conserved hypothetical protein [Mycoplasmopsis alligatoris A21JP2]
MKKNPRFKNKVNLRILAFCMSIVTLISLLFAALGFKVANNYKPSFYNYKSYMSKDNITKLSKNFEYKQFLEINEFTQALVNNRAVAGIGSDFQAVTLIRKNLLKPINFEKFLNLDFEIKSDEHLAKVLEKTYSPIIWRHLKSYDEYLKTDVFGNVINTHLWKYFVPYYTQDAVIAYNSDKHPIKGFEVTEKMLKDNLSKINHVQGIKDELSMFNILNTLKNSGYEHFYMTDALRDNMLYGSGYELNLNNNQRTDSEFTGLVTNSTYERLVNNFTDLIKDSTTYNVKDSNHITFKGDGLEMLNTILDPSKPDAQVAIMYAGDALDAYYSEDNYENVPQGTLKHVKPSKNLLLVDGLVVVDNISNDVEDLVYSTLNEGIYRRNGSLANLANANPEKSIEELLKLGQLNIYKDFLKNEILKADSTKTDTWFEKLNKSLEKDYQVNSITNPWTEKFLKNNPEISAELQKVFELDQEKLAIKLSYQNITDNSADLFDEYSNYENFDFINYTPTNYLEYEFVKNNYFIDEEGLLDEIALSIYEIDLKKDLEHKNFTHEAIKPVDDELLSLINNYYYRQTKN